MLEPSNGADSEGANLRAAVELGQKLLERNQALLQEQLELRRRASEAEARAEEARAQAERARTAEARVEMCVRRMEEMEEEARILQGEARRASEAYERARRAEEEAEELRAELAESQRRVRQLEAHEGRREERQESQQQQQQQQQRQDQPSDDSHWHQRLARKDEQLALVRESFEASSSLVEAQKTRIAAYHQEVESLQEQLRHATEQLEALRREHEAAQERAAAPQPSLMSELQSAVAPQFSMLAAQAHREAPEERKQHKVAMPETASDEVVREYVRLKTEAQYRRAADEEFMARYEQLKSNMEGARLWAVQAYIDAKGEHADNDQLKTLSRERLNNVALEAKLLALVPGICDLVYVRSVVSMMVEHIQTTKALNAALQALANNSKLSLQLAPRRQQ